jgi:methionyl-tRNA formyltransferase
MPKNEKVKIVFMGTPAFAESILAALLENGYEIISVYTQPDKKVGRRQVLQPSPIKTFAQKHQIKIFEPKKFDEPAIAELAEQNPDLLIVAAYGKILPETVLKIPRLGALNVHPSFLPELRGPTPIQNALLLGHKETGTTIMRMDAGIDTGDILSQRKVAIDGAETYPDLSQKLAGVSAELLLDTLPKYMAGKILPEKQNDSAATFCQIIRREDGQISWTDSAEKIYNKFRAFSPWPGIFTTWERNGRTLRVKFVKISLEPDDSENMQRPGEVFRRQNKIVIKASPGSIIVKEIQLEGKSPVTAKDFLNGYPDFIGAILK